MKSFSLLWVALLVLSPVAPARAQAATDAYDLVLVGGRVVDPESGLDGVRSLGIRAGRVVAISEQSLAGSEVLDVSGRVVAPGFIDLHVHGQDPISYDYMAQDGVTSALELEAGAHRQQEFAEAREGRARIHFGASAGHIGARVYSKHGVSMDLGGAKIPSGIRGWFISRVVKWFPPTAWMQEPMDEDERKELVAALETELDAGAIGIGMGLAYTPGADDEEVAAVFGLAAARAVPVFVHLRNQEGPGDMNPLASVIGHAEASGASLHVVHINSSSGPAIRESLEMISAARERGVDVTTEAYPYTAGSTLIESAIFDDGWRNRRGIDYGDLQWVETGERLTAETFKKYRAEGGTVIIHQLKPEWVDVAMASPDVMIASDGMPMVQGAHPRGAGTHSRVLGHYVRERGVMSLNDAVRKLSLLPAQRLETLVPAMRNKGRIRVGADADITVFDPERVIDRATYEDSLRASEGIEHVLVEGTFVVRDGALVQGVSPGQLLRSQTP